MGQTAGKLVTYTLPEGQTADNADDDEDVWDPSNKIANRSNSGSRNSHHVKQANNVEDENCIWHLSITEVPVMLGNSESVVEDSAETVELQQGLLKKHCETTHSRQHNNMKQNEDSASQLFAKSDETHDGKRHSHQHCRSHPTSEKEVNAENRPTEKSNLLQLSDDEN